MKRTHDQATGERPAWNQTQVVMPLAELWYMHLLPLLERRNWVKTRARLRLVSKQQWEWDKPFVPPTNFRDAWERGGWNHKPGATELYYDLARLGWPPGTQLHDNHCILVERPVTFAVEWDEDGDVMTYNELTFVIKWRDDQWDFIEIPDFGGDPDRLKTLYSPLLKNSDIRALRRYINNYCSDEQLHIKYCFGIRVANWF